jgi:glycosyltransferase involved in cell wall biosynthesis
VKIALLSHFFPPMRTAGAENYALGIARAFAAQGHRVCALCAGDWDRGERYWNGYREEVYQGVAVRRLDLCWRKAPDPNRYLFDNPHTAEHVGRWLAEFEPDIAHIVSCYTLSSSAIDACRRAGVPTVLTLVDFWFLCPILHLLRRDGTLCSGITAEQECRACLMRGAKADRWARRVLGAKGAEAALAAVSRTPAISRLRGFRGLALDMGARKRLLPERLRRVDAIIAPSQFIADTHTAALGPLPQMRVMPHGHDLSWTHRLAARPAREETRFCYLGRISPEKGTHLLVEAFRAVEGQLNATLDIWGALYESEYGARVRMLAAGSERIRLRGVFSREELPAVLGEADAVVVPSVWYENNPLVIQEAFAAGVPVIASNLGGMAEFVRDGVSGLLFAPGDRASLADCLARFATDARLRERLRQGIPPVRDMETEITELEAIYRQLIRRRDHA